MPDAPRTLEELRNTILPMLDNVITSARQFSSYEDLERIERDAKWIRDIVRAADPSRGRPMSNYYVTLGVAPESEDFERILTVGTQWIEEPLSRQEIHDRLDLMLDLADRHEKVAGA